MGVKEEDGTKDEERKGQLIMNNWFVEIAQSKEPIPNFVMQNRSDSWISFQCEKGKKFP